MTLQKLIFISLLSLAFSSCVRSPKSPPEIGTSHFPISNLTDQEYPDNPDIGFRASQYQSELFTNGELTKTKNAFIWNFTFHTNQGDSLSLKQVDLSQYIPTIPYHVKADQYLSRVACVNQEWNRNQVKFNGSQFATNIPGVNRVDLARNCLNAYLWEIIVYTEENGKTLPYAHGWFNFPQPHYAHLFTLKNNIAFSEYQAALENWVEPESKSVQFNLLRKKIEPIAIRYSDLSDQMYPKQGARLKKFKEIISPGSFSTMRDLQTDSTLFATFSPPGFYNKQDPRKTELGRFYQLKKVELHTTTSPNTADTLHELALHFGHRTKGVNTTLTIGGLNFNAFPILDEKDANLGWKSSMGIGNHTFYENYSDHIEYKAENSPFYALLTDGQGKWLDSHAVGIDGPIFHFSDSTKSTLHLWLLSFERHALVGHYSIDLSN